MCGIAGFADFSGKSGRSILNNMVDSLAHRGPDDKGALLLERPTGTIGLGHRRLAIIDLSENGHQPMHLGPYTIVYNGEIYNYQEIRTELRALGHAFSSDSDTEVILHAYQEWGRSCVHRFIGMFAFVILDEQSDELIFCRDRAGVKPLFIYWDYSVLLFGSELKALLQHSGFRKKIDPVSLELFLSYGYVPGPGSIFRQTRKARPGCWTIFSLDKREIREEKYWQLGNFYCLPKMDLSYAEAKTELQNRVQKACQYRMVSDVPVGMFLSGGYDSTLVTALLQERNAGSSPLKTFTIGFWDGNDEAPYAEQVAKHLGTDHTTYYCTEADAKAIIPELPFFYDEPAADISNIPTILVSSLARKQVKVALSADGGDELFSGYIGTQSTLNIYQTLERIPLKKLVGNALGQFKSIFHDRLDPSVEKKLEGLSNFFTAPQSERLKVLAEEKSLIPRSIIKTLLKTYSGVKHPFFVNGNGKFSDPKELLLLNSFEGAMTDLLLVKVDRATMSQSLEGREPLLDHHLLEYAAQLPYEFKHDGIQSKKIIRDIVHDYVPPAIMDRPKTGFDLPLFDWLKGDLAYLIEEYLNDTTIARDNFFDVSVVRELKVQFQRKDFRYAAILWRVLTFQMWYKKWML